jgi:alpha-galactosidase
LRFRFHVAMAGVLGIGVNLLEFVDSELAEARSLLAEYKAIRPIVQKGRLYRLSTDDGAVFAVQYIAGPEVVVLAWRPSTRFALPSTHLRLAGLDPSAHYGDHLGEVLMTRGIPLGLPAGDYVSTLIRLTRMESEG